MYFEYSQIERNVMRMENLTQDISSGDDPSYTSWSLCEIICFRSKFFNSVFEEWGKASVILFVKLAIVRFCSRSDLGRLMN